MSHRHHQYLNHLAALLLLAVFCQKTVAQGRFSYSGGYGDPAFLIEAGLSLGVMNGVTDIMGSKNNSAQGPFAGTTLKKSRFSGGLYASALWNNRIGGRLEFNAGSIEGYDSLLVGATSKTAIGRYDRNLNFKSPITELQLSVELHPIMIMSYGDRETPRLSPYILAGIAWFHFYPRAYTADGWVDLPPLRLEGQGFAEYPDRPEYKTNAFAVPFGFGVKYEVNPKFNIRFELNKRTTFTDYIDDVSQANWVDPSLFYKYFPVDKANLAAQLYNRSVTVNPPRNTRPRGHPTENDYYWTAVLKFGINLNRDSYGGSGGTRGMLRQMRCTNF